MSDLNNPERWVARDGQNVRSFVKTLQTTCIASGYEGVAMRQPFNDICFVVELTQKEKDETSNWRAFRNSYEKMFINELISAYPDGITLHLKSSFALTTQKNATLISKRSQNYKLTTTVSCLEGYSSNMMRLHVTLAWQAIDDDRAMED